MHDVDMGTQLVRYPKIYRRIIYVTKIFERKTCKCFRSFINEMFQVNYGEDLLLLKKFKFIFEHEHCLDKQFVLLFLQCNPSVIS